MKLQSDVGWDGTPLEAWLGWMSKVAFSLPSLAAGLGGLEQLGTGWVSVTMWLLHMASWDFFTAWWS